MAEGSEEHGVGEQDQQRTPQEMDESKKPPPAPAGRPSSVSVSIWPPSQRTRDVVIHRLVETLASPSILFKRYGSVPGEEAISAARLVEQEAFDAASAHAAAASDDGMEGLEIYSNEISRRMLEFVKARDAAPSLASSSPIESSAGEEVSPL